PAPVIENLVGPSVPLAVGSQANIKFLYSAIGNLESHSVSIDWGDGTLEPVTAISPGLIQAGHAFSSTGVYTVQVRVSDGLGNVTTASFQYVVIYDPNGGFVTGGGWIMSPAGAYAPNPGLAGKATFGFVSKYQKGANVPTGDTQFQFQVADFKFQSTEYQWL